MQETNQSKQEPNHKKVLIIEDEDMLREALMTALEDVPCVVLTAADGEEGLRVAHTEQPNLILLDMVLPTLSGGEFIKRLRETAWGKDIDVVVLSAQRPEGVAFEEVKADVLEYLVKTEWKLSDVIEHVKELLDKKK